MTNFNPLSSIVSFSLTMSDDNPHRIVDFDLPFYDLNIHCYTNSAKYGNMGVIEATLDPGDVAFFQKGNLKHFMFKNETPGSNTKIVAVATVPTEALKEVLK